MSMMTKQQSELCDRLSRLADLYYQIVTNFEYEAVADVGRDMSPRITSMMRHLLDASEGTSREAVAPASDVDQNSLYGLSWNVTLTGVDGTLVLVPRAHFSGAWVDPQDGVTIVDSSCGSYRVKESIKEIDRLFSFHTGATIGETERMPSHILATSPTHVQAALLNGAGALLTGLPDRVARLALLLDHDGTRLVRGLALIAGDVPPAQRELDELAQTAVVAAALAALPTHLRAPAIRMVSHLVPWQTSNNPEMTIVGLAWAMIENATQDEDELRVRQEDLMALWDAMGHKPSVTVKQEAGDA